MTRPHGEIWSETPLHAAARLGDPAALDAALAAGGDLEARDALGFTPLHVAAIEGNAGSASRLLAAGAAADPRAKEELTPLMLACARARLEVVDSLLAAGASPGAQGSVSLFTMLSFFARGGSLPVLERLAAAGLPVARWDLAGCLRFVLELTGHRVRFAEMGYCRGIAGETDSVWAVDRPMNVPAALFGPLCAENPWYADLQSGLRDATTAFPNYGERFEVRPAAFEQPEPADAPIRWVAPYLEDVHEVRCGRRSATERAADGWSILGRATGAGGDAEVVGALLEASGWDPAAVAAETPEEEVRHEAARGLYPVHRRLLPELAAEAVARRRNRGP